MNLEPNTQIGRYVIQEQIGQGARGIVYRATQQNDPSKEVALKLYPRFLMFNAAARATFKQDLDTLHEIPSPHLVPIHEYGQYKEQVWTAMKFMPNGNLEQKHAEKPLTYRHTFTLYQQLIPALQMVHDAGLVHGNLKPNNILYNGATPAMTDFGLDQGEMANSGLSRRNALRDVRWSSPEQLLENKITGASDTYTMGILLYWLLMGKFPYEAETPAEMEQAHLTAPIPYVGNELDHLLQRMLAKRPEDRYQSIIDLTMEMPLSLSEPKPYVPPAKTKKERSSPNKWWKKLF